MIGLFGKSKSYAKRRLLNCIKKDRDNIFINCDKIQDELESVLSKYVSLDGGIIVKITEQNNKKYIQAAAFIKN